MAQYKRKGNGSLEVIVKFSLYKDLKIVDNTKIRRLGWAGHIIRMEEERIPKKILNGKSQNTRAVGKPRIR